MSEFSSLMMQVQTTMITGVVRVCEGKQFFVECDGDLIMAKKAFGCVITPQSGDTVAMASDQNDHMFIITILERPDSSPATMQFEQGICIETGTGPFAVEGTDIKLHASQHMQLCAIQTEITAIKADAVIEQLTVTGNSAACHWEKVRVVAGTIQTVARSLMTKAIRSLRTIDELLQERAGRIRFLARDTAQLRGRRTSVEAETDVSIKAEKVKLG